MGQQASDWVYASLRQQILDVRMPPGTTFSEGELAASVGLSKTPVREALARLRHDGLVEVKSRSGYRVCDVTIGDARDLLSVRMALETEAVALAASGGAGPESLAQLRELTDAQALLDHDRPRRPVREKVIESMRFHCLIGRSSGNQRLADALDDILAYMTRVLNIALSQEYRWIEEVGQRVALIDLIADGDGLRAREAVRAHIQACERLILDALLDTSLELSMSVGHPVITPMSYSPPEPGGE